MISTRSVTAGAVSLLALLSLGACTAPVQPVVGAWLVKDAQAPFPFHMYVYNADGTMQQANPDAGDVHSSDSDGKGIWIVEGDHVRGKWVEVTADRASHKFNGRTEVSFTFRVDGDRFSGTETAKIFDADGRLTEDLSRPLPISGERVTLR